MFPILRTSRILVLLILILCLLILNLLTSTLTTMRYARHLEDPMRESTLFGSLARSNDIPESVRSSSTSSLIDVPRLESPRVNNESSVQDMYQGGHDVSVAERCPNNGEGIKLVILVTSSPLRLKSRIAIRHTWGSFGQRSDVLVLFILGTTEDSQLEGLLWGEQKLYGDIIRGTFHDSYSNLTLKSISALEWFDRYCSSAKFLLKTDDDMFINVPRLLSFTRQHKNDRNVIFGSVQKKSRPIRNKENKWYAPPAQFRPSVYPDYINGPAYLLTGDIIHRLFETSLNQTYFRIEDVFITGILADILGIKRVGISEFLRYRVSYETCDIQRTISMHGVHYEDQYDLWKKLLDGTSQCKPWFISYWRWMVS